MTDFWRRWHITLTNWFRTYLYQPLGGSRCSSGRLALNLLIVWLATALWHGASLNFLLWGLLLFAILCSERFLTMGLLTGDGIGSQIGSHVYMILLILLQWTIFAIPNMKDLGVYLGRLIGIGSAANKLDFVALLGSYGWLLAWASSLPRRCRASSSGPSVPVCPARCFSSPSSPWRSTASASAAASRSSTTISEEAPTCILSSSVSACS